MLPQIHPPSFESLPLSNWRLRTFAPPQRAYPVDTQDSRYGQFRGHHDPSEQLLRRKTPQGILKNDYDSSTKAPALKHVVLPLSETSAPSYDYSTRLGSSQSRMGYLNWNVQTGHGQLPPILVHNVQQSAYYLNTGPQIPTAPHPVDGGLYGSYCPDGSRGHINQSTHSLIHGQNLLPPSQLFPPVGQTCTTGGMDIFPRMRHTPLQRRSRSVMPTNNYTSISDSTASRQNSSHFSITLDGARIPMLHPTSKTGNPMFKEKTLSWAHSIYVDLLAYLHTSKKENRQLRNSNSSRIHSRNSIYPKPPRQPASYLGFPSWLEGASNERFVESSRRNSDNATAITQNVPSKPIPQWEAPGNASVTRHARSFHQDIPHYVPPSQPSPQQTNSPLSKAKEALEMLTTLCDQSGWRWIDGMLLGGCLAYGLEEYQKALEWYSKIITIDPKHVEAISNLAATLLCLNRREEAEQYWLQSVKLRPSYFEAVEHLIGLLCGDHRGQEAVGIIEFVERSLRLLKPEEFQDYYSETSSNADRDSCDSIGTSTETIAFEYDNETDRPFKMPSAREVDESSNSPGFASSGFSVPGSENGRVLALIHAKGNMLYALGDIDGASKAFEDAVLISAGRSFQGIQDLIRRIVDVLSLDGIGPLRSDFRSSTLEATSAPLLLPPDKALQTARLVFTKNGDLPGLSYVPEGLAKKAAISTTSNSLLSLAKIFQDAMSNSSSRQKISRMPSGVGDILALYYLSLSLQPSPSTANNVGILLASVQQNPSRRILVSMSGSPMNPTIPGVIPGSGVALALAYYNYGLNLDSRHAHIYTNLGSLLKDIGQLAAAITMYEKAVACDGSFDIALANLANAVKDQGRTSDAIAYYRRAVASSPDFAEAVCGLANALNSVCDWAGRGGVILDSGRQDKWHVDENGMIVDARNNGNGSGWMKRVVDIVAKQLKDGSAWGRGTFQDQNLGQFILELEAADSGGRWSGEKREHIRATLASWIGTRWEGARIIRLIERATKRAMHRWYTDKYIRRRELPASHYPRPRLPASLAVPSAPTVLPFHTFTCPLSAKDIRMISQRNALRISSSTLKSIWMQGPVFSPPPPPSPYLNIGYVSSDFNNHPLAHLMQSVFGLHNPLRAKAFCYATTASDSSVHRQQIEREAPVFRDVSTWSTDRLVEQIVQDEIHILVNLNGYTRGARNEIFAARPAPIQMSFMGFAGTLGAEWCDYLLADETAVPPETLRPWRRNIDLEDQVLDEQSHEAEDWVYSENIIFCRDTFFCCDHAQSEPRERQLSWEEEQIKRWQMRKQLFPSLSDDAVILGNFNQLYKIEPTTFRTWLRILDKVPKAILWLLRFPDLGESNLKRTAQDWAGESVASRIWFTDVAPKHEHISRARVCDLFLDTPECNAHTTAADVLWSSTPLLTLPRYKYKMCSRMAASILKGALPNNEAGRRAAEDLIAEDDAQYEKFAIQLASDFTYKLHPSGHGQGLGRLGELRQLLYDSRWTCALFDTKRWVSDLEMAYEEAWRRWVAAEGGDIYL